MTPLCRRCGERPSQPARARIRDYICVGCFSQRPSTQRYLRSAAGRRRGVAYNRTAKGQARVRRYEATPSRQQKRALYSSLRLWLGRRYIGRAETIAEKQRLQAHIRRLLAEFTAGIRHGDGAVHQGDG